MGQAGTGEAGTGVIVVGIDGSTEAVQALRWAVREAARRGATVRAVAVYDRAVMDVYGANVLLHPFTGNPSRAFEHATTAVDTVRGDAGTVPVEPEAIEGDPGHVLCELGAAAALVVVGRHGTRPGPHRLGSVASYVTHHCACPVVVVPASR
jgi:nucleotide-binding universal stress UspA family protein